jgi:hypothetical protein
MLFTPTYKCTHNAKYGVKLLKLLKLVSKFTYCFEQINPYIYSKYVNNLSKFASLHVGALF